MIKKVQIIYRLEDHVVLAWALRPADQADSFNVYFSPTKLGTYEKIGTVDNTQAQSRSYHGKVSFTLIPKNIPGWDVTKANFIKIAPVISGVEGSPEDPVSVPPYSVAGLRLSKDVTPSNIAVGYNPDEDRFIPLNVDTDGKLRTA